MRNCVILIVLLVLGLSECFSQDTIIMQSKDVIIAKVTEILPEYVKYKKFNNLDGPDYTLLKTDVKRIVYQNGTIDVFPDSDKPKGNDYNTIPWSRRTQAVLCAGFSFSSLAGDALYTNFKRGASVGFGVDFPINESGNSFEFALFFEEKGTNFSDIQQELDGEQYTLSETVVFLDYTSLSFAYKRFFGAKELLYVKGGVYAGYRLSGDMKGKIIKLADNTEQYFNTSVDDFYTALDAGATIGIGLNLPITKGEFPTKLIVESRYNLGLSNIYVSDTSSSSEKYRETNQNFLLLAGLRFHF